MEFLPKHPLLEFPPETLSAVRKLHDLDKPGKMEEAIDILDDWVQKQNHFKKKKFDRHYLETTILSCKGSIERAKSRIDKYCTARTMMPSYFGVLDITKDLKPIKSSAVLLPKFAPGFKRVYVIKPSHNSEMDHKSLIDFCRFNIVLNDYLKAHDYFDGIIGILDYTDFKISEFLKSANPVEMRNLSVFQAEAYGNRVAGIHILTESKMIDTLVALYKQVVSEKIGKRIQVHKTIQSIYDVVPKEILPEEYGGNERSIEVLRDEWLKVLASKETIEFLKTMNEAGTDEKLRPRDEFNNQYMGMPGTFRNLKVD